MLTRFGKENTHTTRIHHRICNENSPPSLKLGLVWILAKFGQINDLRWDPWAEKGPRGGGGRASIGSESPMGRSSISPRLSAQPCSLVSSGLDCLNPLYKSSSSPARRASPPSLSISCQLSSSPLLSILSTRQWPPSSLVNPSPCLGLPLRPQVPLELRHPLLPHLRLRSDDARTRTPSPTWIGPLRRQQVPSETGGRMSLGRRKLRGLVSIARGPI
jgi:hypothetical protein